MIRRCLVLMQSMAMGCELRRAGGWMLICDVSSCAPSLSSAITSWVNSWHLAFRRALIPPLSHDGASLVFVCLTFRTMLSVAFVGGSSASHTSEDGLSLHVSASLVYVCWHLLGWLSLLGAHCRRYDSSWHLYHTSWSWCAWWLGDFSASCQARGITCSIVRYIATSFAIPGWRAWNSVAVSILLPLRVSTSSIVVTLCWAHRTAFCSVLMFARAEIGDAST